MKQTLKNEVDILDLMNKIQAQLSALDQKVNTLINRSMPQVKPPSPRPPEDNNRRAVYNVICADCKKECTIPFKPSGDRPVYCKDCFSRRKVISMSGMKDVLPQTPPPAPEAKTKKKAVAVKKTVAKKKSAPKKK